MERIITHYTHSINTIEQVLNNGLAWVPNKRNLIASLVDHHDFSKREPQEFGMISFTELPASNTKQHRDVFGNYGIVMTPKWVSDNNVQKVMYIDTDGPVHEALTTLFNIGYFDLKSKIKHSEDGMWEMSYTNKAMAGAVAGSQVWACLLQLYEYFEPIKYSYQQEWRIVQKEPLYGYKETKEEVIKNVSPPVGWASIINVIKVQPKDIQGFICPQGDEPLLLKALPESYRSHKIDTYKA